MQRLLTLTALSLIAVASLIAFPSNTVKASSHREAPLTSKDPTADNTDVYAFRSPDAPDTVTLIADYIPLEEPANGPIYYNFDDTVLYEIHVDNNGDANEDLVYQFRFTTRIEDPNSAHYATGVIESLDDPNYNIKQFATVTEVRARRVGRRPLPGQSTVLGSNLILPPVNIGPKATPNYEALAAAAIHTLPGGARFFAGQRDDPFYVDIGALEDLLDIRNPGVDGLAGFNIHTIAIQLPIAQLTANGSTPSATTDPNAVIGVWATASRQRVTVLTPRGGPVGVGAYQQVSRLGNPLVNELVIPLRDKDNFNRSQPRDDAQFLPYVLNPEPARLLNQFLGFNAPTTDRQDLVMVYLTGIQGLNQPPGVQPAEEMRLNVAVPPSSNPNRLGVIGGDTAGYPNGRRITDDAVDITLQAAGGELVGNPNDLGDNVNANDRPFVATFPYLATPTSGFLSPHGEPDPSGGQ